VRPEEDEELLWKFARALSNRTAETDGRAIDRSTRRRSRSRAQSPPGSARTHTMLAVALGRTGAGWRTNIDSLRGEVVDMGRDLTATRRAIEIDPHDPALHRARGLSSNLAVPLVVKLVARTFLGGYPPVSLRQSTVSLQRAIRLGPNDVTAHLELARTYRAMGRRGDARAEIEKALAAPVREQLDVVEKAEAEALLAELD
jgi:hypothetical protein